MANRLQLQVQLASEARACRPNSKQGSKRPRNRLDADSYPFEVLQRISETPAFVASLKDLWRVPATAPTVLEACSAWDCQPGPHPSR